MSMQNSFVALLQSTPCTSVHKVIQESQLKGAYSRGPQFLWRVFKIAW